MSEKAHPRKKIFVDKRFQARFIFNYIALIIVGTILFGLASYFILDRAMGESLFSAHLAITRTGDLLRPTLIYLSTAFIIILGVATWIMTLLISHRISGPLFAISRYLKMMSSGQLDFEAKLRTKDQTAVLADNLTETVGIMADRVNMVRESLDSLKEDLNKFSGDIQGGKLDQGELSTCIHDLNEHLRVLEDRIAFFKT